MPPHPRRPRCRFQPPLAGPPGQPAPCAAAPRAVRSARASWCRPRRRHSRSRSTRARRSSCRVPPPRCSWPRPDIADVQVRSPNMVYVFAKKPGDTVLYAVDAQDRVLLNTIVTRDLAAQPHQGRSSTRIHPGNGVIFDNQGETIVLTGSVRSAAVAEDARRLALQQVSGNPNKVISNIQHRRAEPGPAPRQGGRGQARFAEARRHQLAEHQQHRPVRHGRHPGRLRRQDRHSGPG